MGIEHKNFPEAGSHSTSVADILVIEDNIEHLKLLKDMLSNAGYRVRPVRTGRAGLRAARLQTPDLILLDINLPDSDGYSVCKTLKGITCLQDVPVIFISGMIDIHSQISGFEVGGRDYITKPFEELVVIARVENQLEIQRSHQQKKHHAQLQERHRIARELHDSVNQTLFVLGAATQAMITTESDLSLTLTEKLKYLQELSQSALEEMRMLLFELHPETLLHTSFAELLNRFINALKIRTSAEFQVHINDDHGELEKDLGRKVTLYRIVQEALSNAVKHAQARYIQIKIVCRTPHAYLSIEDDGIGFDAASPSLGLGIANMHQRADEAHMHFSIQSHQTVGTKIKVSWELEELEHYGRQDNDTHR